MKARIPNQGGQANMMKRIQQMQEDMARVQQECEEAEYNASAGGGAIDVTVNGKHQLVSVKIDPDVVDPEDVEMLEDLLVAAVNEAIDGIKGKGFIYSLPISYLEGLDD